MPHYAPVQNEGKKTKTTQKKTSKMTYKIAKLHNKPVVDQGENLIPYPPAILSFALSPGPTCKQVWLLHAC